MSGPGHEVVKEREGIAAKMEVLVKEWKEKMSGSVELRIARENLKILRMKIRELTEELFIAEEFEGELEAKRRRIEESLVPPILRFFDKPERMEVINDILLQETFSSGREQMFKMLEWGARRVKGMKRPAVWPHRQPGSPAGRSSGRGCPAGGRTGRPTSVSWRGRSWRSGD